jgi:hypothetical protein
MRVVQAVSVAWRDLMGFGCVLVFCATLYFSIRDLAGRQTLADLKFSAIADLKANKYFGVIFPWGLWTFTALWGGSERWLRKRHIKRVSSESSEMQRKFDPGRRSSGLSKKGDTNPEDF